MEPVFVFAVCVIVAALLYRGLEPWRPVALRPLSLVVGSAMAVPVVITTLSALAHAVDGVAVRFAGFAVGVTLIGYMLVAGGWALRFLAEQVATYRS